MNKQEKACCVFGHRKITDEENLKIRLTDIMEALIANEGFDTFYLGSRSDFNSLCCDVLSELKEKYPHIRRIYVRAEYPDINEGYEKYLLEDCDETYFPERIKNAGKSVYVERNYEIIDKSSLCIVYFKDGYLPPKRKTGSFNMLLDYQPKSGTGIAYKYAVQKKRKIINLAKWHTTTLL